MSRYNISKMINEYTDDFGNTYKNVPIKIQGSAPHLDTFYQARTKAVCGGARIFKMRHFEVVFGDGRKLMYPIPKPDSILAWGNVLENANGNDDAICINYIGEHWSVVPATYLKGATLDFRKDPYTNLPARKTYKSYTYKYTSEVSTIGEIKMNTRIPVDSTELNTCQKEGLIDPEEGLGICSGANQVDPRHFIIQARSTDSFNAEDFKANKVIRKAIVSDKTQLKDVAQEIAKCGECLGYQGESIPNIHLLFTLEDAE